MDTLIKADIFFVIASVATIVLTILCSILLFYLIRAGRNLRILLDSLKSDYEDSEEFLTELKDRLEGNIFFRMIFPSRRKKGIKSNKDESVKK